MRYPLAVVPTLLAAAAALTCAEESAGLTVGGYVSVIGSVSQIAVRDGTPVGSGPVVTPNPGGADSTNAFLGQAALDLVAPGASPDGADESLTTGFTVDAQVRLGYAFSPLFRTTLDVQFDNAYSNDVRIQQARLDLQLNDRCTITAGKAEGILGWEASDRDQLWRVNRGLTSGLAGSETLGGLVAWRLTERSEMAFGLYNGLGLGAYRDDTNVNANGEVAVAAEFSTEVIDVADLDFEVAYDPHSFDWDVSNDTGEWADVLQAGINATVQLVNINEALRLGGEIVYRRTGESSPRSAGREAFDTLAFSVVASHRLPTTAASNLSAGYAKVMEDFSGDGVMKHYVNEAFVAIQSKLGLEGLEMLGISAEATYRWEDGGGNDGVHGNIWGGYLQLIAVLP